MTLTDLARRYFDAIERSDRDALLAMLAPDVVQIELPNRLVPDGATRDREALLDGFERGQKVVREQRYVILGSIESGDSVALEVDWRGTLALPVGRLVAGDEMRARFAVFLQFRDGTVVSQRNYDCFEPF